MCARVLIPDPVPPSKFRMSNLIVFLSVLIPVSEILYIEQPSAGDSVNILLETNQCHEGDDYSLKHAIISLHFLHKPSLVPRPPAFFGFSVCIQYDTRAEELFAVLS